MRNWSAGIFALVLACGCGGKDEPIAKYDGLKDNTSSSLELTPIQKRDSSGVSIELKVNFLGKGKHPKIWNTSLMIHGERPPETPSLLGPEPELKIFIGNSYLEKTKKSTNFEFKRQNVSETAFFDMHLDGIGGLVEFIDGDGRYELNGKPYTISREDREKIKERIIALREITNQGK